ncbi:MAG: hypothetical protein JSU01_09300 [Bacteroidetes bacterium]|nr:hypothetical protein [Bacteroidota bacterium]
MALNYPLSNIQIELLKLFGTNLSERDLIELKQLLSKFCAKKAISLADDIWDKKGLSDQEMDTWLNRN